MSGGYARSPRVSTSQPIHRTLDAQRAAVHHVQVHHRRRDVARPEQFLHRANVIAVFKEMGREGMAQRILTLLMNRPPPSFTTVTILFTANT